MSIYTEPERADFWQLYRDSDGSYLNPTGPRDCQAHSASRMVMRHHEGQKLAGITGTWPPTGALIRRYTGDTSGGLTHAQVARVARERYATNLAVYYRMPFPDVIDLVEETRGLSLSVWYRRIRDSVYRGSFTFYQNHEIFIGGVDRERGVFTGVVDPLADGRQAGLFEGPGTYPIALLRMAAGELNVARDPADYVPLGVGLAYAMFTRPTGDAPVVAPPPSPTNYGANPMIQLDGPSTQRLLFGTGTPRRMALPKGTVVYRSPSPAGSEILDRLGADVKAVMVGIPRDGWRSVIVSTRNFPDNIRRDVIAYVPKSAGVIS